ncbi:hypothetical protein ILYODFUR_038174 [Ilyodon furcidens]|uniref:Uncharacterized protein n=1 Tax=Ilyodon furcidens TaxID=33524 RepID=A0ABV0VCC5_9TELE
MRVFLDLTDQITDSIHALHALPVPLTTLANRKSLPAQHADLLTSVSGVCSLLPGLQAFPTNELIPESRHLQSPDTATVSIILFK